MWGLISGKGGFGICFIIVEKFFWGKLDQDSGGTCDYRSSGWDQILANNLTPLRYSKKNRYSAIPRVQTPSQIGGYKSSFDST